MKKSRKRKQPIRKVFLDVGDVLIKIDTTYFYREFAALAQIPETRVLDALRGDNYGYSDLFLDYECGRITSHAFFNKLTRVLDVRIDGRVNFNAFAKLWVGVFSDNDTIDPILSRLPQHKLLITNINALAYSRYVAHCPLVKKHVPRVCDRIRSDKVGVIKPAPAIYEYALDHAQALPEECVFLDNMPVNLLGWRALGGHGVLYDAKQHSNEELEYELDLLGMFP